MGTTLMDLLPSFLDELAPMTKTGAPFAATALKAVASPLESLGRVARGVVSGQIRGPGGFIEAGKRLEPILHGRIGHPIAEGWRGLGRAGRHVQRPIEGFARGMEGRYGVDPNALIQQVGKGTVSKIEQIGLERQLAEAAGKKAPTNLHLLEHADTPIPMLDILKGKIQGKGRAQAMAEELSRRGWTGEGRFTKYMPVGGKGMLAGLTLGLDVPHVLSDEPGAEGQGRVGKALEGAGSLAGMIAGSGLGLLPMSAMWYGGAKGGELLGRAIEGLGRKSPEAGEVMP